MLIKSHQAIELLKLHPHEIDWKYLSSNSSTYAVELLLANLDKIHWKRLSYNKHPKAVELLAANLDRVDWEKLTYNRNPQAMQLLIQHYPEDNLANYHILSHINHSNVISILSKHTIKPIYPCEGISRNESSEALALLKLHPRQICWNSLSYNSHPEALELLALYPDRINWFALCENSNPDVKYIFRDNAHKIDYDMMQVSDFIFEIDIDLTYQCYVSYLNSFNIK